MRRSSQAWSKIAVVILPDTVPLFSSYNVLNRGLVGIEEYISKLFLFILVNSQSSTAAANKLPKCSSFTTKATTVEIATLNWQMCTQDSSWCVSGRLGAV